MLKLLNGYFIFASLKKSYFSGKNHFRKFACSPPWITAIKLSRKKKASERVEYPKTRKIVRRKTGMKRARLRRLKRTRWRAEEGFFWRAATNVLKRGIKQKRIRRYIYDSFFVSLIRKINDFASRIKIPENMEEIGLKMWIWKYSILKNCEKKPSTSFLWELIIAKIK